MSNFTLLFTIEKLETGGSNSTVLVKDDERERDIYKYTHTLLSNDVGEEGGKRRVEVGTGITDGITYGL